MNYYCEDNFVLHSIMAGRMAGRVAEGVADRVAARAASEKHFFSGAEATLASPLSRNVF